MAQKKYAMVKSKGDKQIVYKGTLKQLIENFKWTLEIGNSHDTRIQRYPKTFKSFVDNLQKTYRFREGCISDRTFVFQASEEDLKEFVIYELD